MRPEILNPIFGLIENLQGIGSRYNKLVCNLTGGAKIVDLLWHLPLNIIDRTYGVPLNQAAAGRILNGILDDIADATVNGEGVVFSNFGSWTTAPTQARTGRNPRTNEEIQIPAGRRIKFIPGKGFKKQL